MSLTKVSFSMINGAVYNVLDFGAVADWNGTTGTDNAAAFLIAYEAVKATGGTLFFPQGSYYTSDRLGSNPNDYTDFADNVEFVGETGTNLIFSDTYAGACVSVNGDNVAIRNLNINSTRTIDYTAPLDPQRVIYQIGAYAGGKQFYNLLGNFRTNVQVTGCTITNMNLPIAISCAGDFVVSDNILDQFTDTGIVPTNMTVDGLITGNKITRGGDDCIFVGHESSTAYASSGALIGRIQVTNNILQDTFGKFCGFGGVGQVVFSNNVCSLSYADGIDFTNAFAPFVYGGTNPNNFADAIVEGNIISLAGRNWSTTALNPIHRTPYAGDGGSAMTSINLPGNTYFYRNISFINNKVISPEFCCVHTILAKDIFVSGNTFTAGGYDHGAGQVNSLIGVNITATSDIVVTENAFVNSLGQNFPTCYSVASSTGTVSNVRIFNNSDRFSTAVIAFSDGPAVTATKFNSYDYTSGGSQFNLAPFTFANLPAQTNYTGSVVYCTNGRKVGEGSGAGTGVPVYYANGAWRVFSTDAAVAI
jgi:hypothetical protein